MLIGFLGGWFVDDYICLIDVFVAFNIWQSSFTDFSRSERFYEKYLVD